MIGSKEVADMIQRDFSIPEKELRGGASMMQIKTAEIVGILRRCGELPASSGEKETATVEDLSTDCRP